MSQSLAQIYIHIIFSTKNRESFLGDETIRREMHAYLATVLREYDSKAIVIDGIADHVRILCNLSRKFAVSEIIREAKRNSSKWIKTKGGTLSAFGWQNGYGAFSVSHSNVARVRDYILRQEEHHRKVDFRYEFRKFLNRHGIEFDERYVWD